MECSVIPPCLPGLVGESGRLAMRERLRGHVEEAGKDDGQAEAAARHMAELLREERATALIPYSNSSARQGRHEGGLYICICNTE